MNIVAVLIKLEIAVALLIILFMLIKESKNEGLLENPMSGGKNTGDSMHPIHKIMKLLVCVLCVNAILIARMSYDKISIKNSTEQDISSATESTPKKKLK
jgi:preprotein translocase subunit SecG